MVDSNAARHNNPTKEYLMGLEDKPLMDEFVALYIGLTSNDKLERQFRESLNVSLTTTLLNTHLSTILQTHFCCFNLHQSGQDEGAYHLSKSGDMDAFAINNLKTFMKNNAALLGKGQSAAQAAKYQNMYSGKEASDYQECFKKLKNFIDQSLDEFKSELVRVLFPIFLCLYLNMVLKKFYSEARTFLDEHKNDFHPYHKKEIAMLETVTD